MQHPTDIHNKNWSDEKNQRSFSENAKTPIIHGHNYELEVKVLFMWFGYGLIVVGFYKKYYFLKKKN